MSTAVSLALQGGGAHGAFTWGVLDRLLEVPDLVIEGISGTSAGAMNACVLAQGLMDDGAEGARRELAGFWQSISDLGLTLHNPYQTTPFHALARAWNLDWTPASIWLDVMAQFVSPYQLNPLDRNPLAEILDRRLDFARLRTSSPVKLFICATNLKTNKMRIFERGELSTRAILASACLPQFNRAVEVDGEFYWDGGYSGNPVLKPLIRKCAARDIVLVKLNPLRREQLPISARDILDRMNEVTMNAALMRELDAIATINRLIREGQITDPRYDHIRFHAIDDPEVMTGLGVRSKNNTSWAFLTYLHDAGRARASQWLESSRDRIGRESTLDLDEFAV